MGDREGVDGTAVHEAPHSRLPAGGQHVAGPLHVRLVQPGRAAPGDRHDPGQVKDDIGAGERRGAVTTGRARRPATISTSRPARELRSAVGRTSARTGRRPARRQAAHQDVAQQPCRSGHYEHRGSSLCSSRPMIPPCPLLQSPDEACLLAFSQDGPSPSHSSLWLSRPPSAAARSPSGRSPPMPAPPLPRCSARARHGPPRPPSRPGRRPPLRPPRDLPLRQRGPPCARPPPARPPRRSFTRPRAIRRP